MSIEVVEDRDAYRALCAQDESIQLFSQAWWLDAVASNQWSALVARDGSGVVGALPYVRKRKGPYMLLTHPKLTQSLGPWIRPTQKSYPKRLAHEKDVLGALAQGLPAHDYYAQNWHCALQNWLPFYWAGFEQTTRYTYRLSLSGDESTLWKGFQENVRREVRKAEGRAGITVRPVCDLEEFLTLNAMTFQRQNRRLPYSRELVRRIDAAAAERGSRAIWIAEDAQGALHAGAYIVWSGDTAYYLMGGGDPALRNSGATSLCLWHAIRNLPTEIQIFDFEGSMVEPIERFFRGFGAMQTPYFHVRRVRSRLLRALLAVR